jgi:ParB/RepB/Spo0J family partition protein
MSKTKDEALDLSRPSGKAADEATLIRLASTDGLPAPETNYFKLPKEDFSLHPNYRSKDRDGLDAESLDGLRMTIETAGQLMPVIVDGRDDDGKWRIVDGQRRYYAIMRSTVVTTIKMELQKDIEGSERKRLIVQLLTNNQRRDVNPVDNARAHLHLLAEFGNDRAKLCEALGIAESSLSKIIAVSRAPDVVTEFVKKHAVPDQEAIYNLSKLHGTTPEKAVEIMEAFDANPEAFDLRQVTRDAIANTRTKVPGSKQQKKEKEEVGQRGRAAKVDKLWIEVKDGGAGALTLVAKGTRHRFQLTPAAYDSLAAYFDPTKTKPEQEEKRPPRPDTE